MAEQYRVAVIGAGRPWRTEGATGFGMSHVHVHAYQKTGKPEQAAGQFRKVMALAPDTPEAARAKQLLESGGARSGS